MCPSDLDDVRTRINFSKTRIFQPSKLSDLLLLVDNVYCDRKVSFHRNILTAVETKRKEKYSSAQMTNDGTVIPSPPMGIDGSPFGQDYEYSAGQLVALRCSAVNNPHLSWIAQIIDEHRNKVRKTVHVTVQWYETHYGGDAYSGSYRDLEIGDKGLEKRWTDIFDVCSVLMMFDGLTRKSKLPAKVIRDLQSMVK